MKIVVFDLDETLGYFSKLSIFWDCFENYLHNKLTKQDFTYLLDTFPEFIRPNIINILKYLKEQKMAPLVFPGNPSRQLLNGQCNRS
jgi:hypothetical protein